MRAIYGKIINYSFQSNPIFTPSYFVSHLHNYFQSKSESFQHAHECFQRKNIRFQSADECFYRGKAGQSADRRCSGAAHNAYEAVGDGPSPTASAWTLAISKWCNTLSG
jgi:hypothetical protein